MHSPTFSPDQPPKDQSKLAWFRQSNATTVLVSETIRNSENEFARRLLPVIRDLGRGS